MERFVLEYYNDLSDAEEVIPIEAESEAAIREALLAAVKEHIFKAGFSTSDLWHGVVLANCYRKISEARYLELENWGVSELLKTKRNYYQITLPEISTLEAWFEQNKSVYHGDTPDPEPQAPSWPLR